MFLLAYACTQKKTNTPQEACYLVTRYRMQRFSLNDVDLLCDGQSSNTVEGSPFMLSLFEGTSTLRSYRPMNKFFHGPKTTKNCNESIRSSCHHCFLPIHISSPLSAARSKFFFFSRIALGFLPLSTESTLPGMMHTMDTPTHFGKVSSNPRASR
jgi:hypothetical protein